MQKARLSVYEDTLKHEAGRGKKSTQKISSPSRLGILDIVPSHGPTYTGPYGANCADRSGCVEVEVAVLGFLS